MSATNTTKASPLAVFETDALSGETLDQVVGGLNPQPLPPFQAPKYLSLQSLPVLQAPIFAFNL
jgi:hypothetical protein